MIEFRAAKESDLSTILALLADDPLGRKREIVSNQEIADPYLKAFQAIEQDSNNQMIVAIDGVKVIGYCQLTFIPGLSRQGSWRAQIESVRIASNRRSAGLGAAMMGHVIDLAKTRGCRLVQLTSDKQRFDSHRFYARLGFVASHDGFKMTI